MTRHSFSTAFCDRCHSEHHDMECDLCPKCNAVHGCETCGRRVAVLGTRLCAVCERRERDKVRVAVILVGALRLANARRVVETTGTEAA